MPRRGTPPKAVKARVCPTGAQLQVREFQPSALPVDLGVLATPVELEGFTRCKTQWHISLTARSRTTGFPPPTDEVRHPSVPPGIAVRLQLLEQHLPGPPVASRPTAVSRQPGDELIPIRINDAARYACRVRWLGDRRLPQPVAHRVPRQASLPRDLPHRQSVPKM